MRELLISLNFPSSPKKIQSSTSIYKKTTETYSSSTQMRTTLGPTKMRKGKMWTWMKLRRANELLY